jgi:hypothetical protein
MPNLDENNDTGMMENKKHIKLFVSDPHLFYLFMRILILDFWWIKSQHEGTAFKFPLKMPYIDLFPVTLTPTTVRYLPTPSSVKFYAYSDRTSKLDADPHPDPSGDRIPILPDPGRTTDRGE